MKIDQFIEEHESEFIMCMLELEGVLLAASGTLNYLAMLHHQSVF